jgi:hypothetical protein
MKATHSVSDNLKKLPVKKTFSRCPWDLHSLKQVEWAICLGTTTKEIYPTEILEEVKIVMVLWELSLSLELIRGKHLKQIFYSHMTLGHFQKEETLKKMEIDLAELQCKEIREQKITSSFQILSRTIQHNLMCNIFRKMSFNNQMMMMSASLHRSNLNWT